MGIHWTTELDPAEHRVAVYWNLSKHLWSIKLDERVGDHARGKVIGWTADPFALVDVRFHVATTQHRNALLGIGARGTKRNVVAWVCGKLADADAQVICGRRVTFHWPDARSTFHCVDNDAPISNADAAVFTVENSSGRARGIVHV